MQTPPSPSSAATARWVATCPDETKGLLADELLALGIGELEPIYRGVRFVADLETAYRAHLWLRTASRIQRLLAEVPATTSAELEAAAASLDWTAWLRPRYPLAISPILTDDQARRLGEQAVQEVVAGAVAQSFARAGKEPPRLAVGRREAVTVVVHVRRGVATLALDTAGRALHKRGWRLAGHPAVLKETLAASVLLLAGYDGTEPLLDPMCGSGTLAIEAAYIALDKAPLIHRGKDDFGFEHQAGFDRALWRRVADEARRKKRPEPGAPIFASDIDPTFVDLARRTALRARVERHLTLSACALQDLEPPAPTGLLVANLPYGERLARGALPSLYRDLGRALHARFAAWRWALLVPADAPLDALGVRPTREVALTNGALAVRLLLRERG